VPTFLTIGFVERSLGQSMGNRWLHFNLRLSFDSNNGFFGAAPYSTSRECTTFWC